MANPDEHLARTQHRTETCEQPPVSSGETVVRADIDTNRFIGAVSVEGAANDIPDRNATSSLSANASAPRNGVSPSSRKRASIVDFYITQVKEFDLLSAQEESALSTLIREGREAIEALNSEDSTLSGGKKRQLRQAVRSGEEAKEKLISSNLRYVVYIANKYRWTTLDIEDLIQEGNIGLITAAEKYDGRKGFRFTTYANWWVRQAISRAINTKSDSIRVPGHIHEGIRLAKSFIGNYHQENGTNPSVEVIAQSLEKSVDQVLTILHAMTILRPVSLDASFGEDDSFTFVDTLPDTSCSVDDQALKAIAGLDIREILGTLSKYDRQIIEMRFLGLNAENGPLSLEEIAEIYGITKIVANQTIMRILAKLRHPSMRIITSKV